MVAGRPYYQRYPSDFIMGTMTMDLETRGAYSLLIDLMNERDRPLPDEPRFIAGQLNCTAQKWRAIREKLLADPRKLYIDADGCLTNPRFEREREQRQKAHARSVEAGRKGGEKSAAQRQAAFDLGQVPPPKHAKKLAKFLESSDQPPEPEQHKINDIDQPPPQPIPETRDHIEEEEEESCPPPPESRARSWDAVELANQLARVAGVRHIDPNRVAGNIRMAREWIELGATFPEIEAAIIEVRDKHRNGAIQSLKYFDSAIRRRHAQREHPASEQSAIDDIEKIRDPILRDYFRNNGKFSF